MGTTSLPVRRPTEVMDGRGESVVLPSRVQVLPPPSQLVSPTGATSARLCVVSRIRGWGELIPRPRTRRSNLGPG